MESTETDKVKSTSQWTASNSKSIEALSPNFEDGKPKKNWFKRLMLLWLTLGAVIIGVTAGMLLKNVEINDETKRLIAFPGVIFMNMIKMIMLPLVITSLLTGLAQISGKNMGRLIGITFSLYGFTTLLAVNTGIALVTVIHPGDILYNNTETDEHSQFDSGTTPIDTVLDMIRNVFPPNLFEAFLKQAQTKYETKQTFNETTNTTDTEKIHKIVYRDGSNIIGLIAICMAVGICLSNMGKKKNRIVVEFLTILDEVVTVLVRLVMWYSPIGIISFIIDKILEVPDLLSVLTMLSKFAVTLAASLLIHALITLPLLYFILTRKNPFKIHSGMAPACLIGFAAYSSGAAMPTSIICVEENLKVPKMVARFVVPIGITNGTALWEAVAAIFIAQLAGRVLSVGDILTIGVTSTLAGLATAAIPHANLVTLVMVLASIGLPTNGIELLFTIDWLVGRWNAAVNILGDGFVAGIVAHFIEKKEKKRRAQGIEENQSGSLASESNELVHP